MRYDFSSTAGLREWRRGRFHVMAVPGPGAGRDEITRPRLAHVGNDRLPPHVSLTVSTQLDGVRFLTRCHGCGARQEEDGSRMHSDPLAVEAFKTWLADHANCDKNPVVHAMPASLSALAHQVLCAAKRAVSQGKPFPPFLYLLADDGRAWAVPYRRDGAYGDSLDHDVDLETAWIHTWVRKWRRERGVHLQAALTVAEAWAWPEQECSGQTSLAPMEILLGVAVTRSEGFHAMSNITRANGIPGVGPGSFFAPEWTPLVDEAPIVDFLLAE